MSPLSVRKYAYTPENPRRRISWSQAATWAGLTALAVTVVYPLFWVVVLSLKSQEDYDTSSPWALPRTLVLGNYLTILKNSEFLHYVLNTLIITFFSVLLIVVLGAMAGYSAAKFRSRLIGFFALVILIAMMIPRYMVLMPLLVITNRLHLISTPWAVVGPYVAFGVPLALYIFRGFFHGIPDSLMEAAKIDGATEMQVFTRVMLPMAKPAFATVIVIQFLGVWGEFMLALVLLQDQASYNLMLGLNNLRGQYIARYPLQAAGLFLASLPGLLLYAFFNRTIIMGMVSGSVKG